LLYLGAHRLFSLACAHLLIAAMTFCRFICRLNPSQDSWLDQITAKILPVAGLLYSGRTAAPSSSFK
jgi:hypothetical protein